MRSVGLVGGLGPESTIDYYRRIIAAWQQQDPSGPSILIDSLDLQRGIELAASDHAGLTAFLAASVRRLAAAGVHFIAMTANTAHLVFDEVAARSPVPLISIVETCADEAKRRSLARPLLLGTGFTMGAPFYPAVFARRGMEVVTPTADERAWVHEKYLGELLKGSFRDDTRQGFVELVDRARTRDKVDSVILGGTELPLLLKTPAVAGLPTLDTTELHVAAIVDRLRQG